VHIFIKNKNLIIDHYNIKCAVGKRGIGNKKKEGDQITPRGRFRIKSIFYRKDRVHYLKSKISKFQIRKNMGWCDDPKSRSYNKFIRFPFMYSAEKLYRKDNIYDIILVLNFNTNPTYKNKGSAIFIHVAKKKFQSTKGCIAIAKIKLKELVKKIDNKTTINVS
tara:strand:+ start:421 stop:912 length:492 start_codon:yes stop_codon:yes gene_type:complete